MSISLAILYYIYLVLVAVFLIFSFFNVYHLVRFGFLTPVTIFIVTFYLLVSIAIISISWGYISQIDWQQAIALTPQL